MGLSVCVHVCVCVIVCERMYGGGGEMRTLSKRGTHRIFFLKELHQIPGTLPGVTGKEEIACPVGTARALRCDWLEVWPEATKGLSRAFCTLEQQRPTHTKTHTRTHRHMRKNTNTHTSLLSGFHQDKGYLNGTMILLVLTSLMSVLFPVNHLLT